MSNKELNEFFEEAVDKFKELGYRVFRYEHVIREGYFYGWITSQDKTKFCYFDIDHLTGLKKLVKIHKPNTDIGHGYAAHEYLEGGSTLSEITKEEIEWAFNPMPEWSISTKEIETLNKSLYHSFDELIEYELKHYHNELKLVEL